jgi:hypothetical protein
MSLSFGHEFPLKETEFVFYSLAHPRKRIRTTAMLPTIDLNLGQMCAPAFDMNDGRRTFIGHTYAYYLDTLRNAALKAKKSLDRIIIEAVLTGVTGQPFRSKALFWYAPGSDMVFLTVCDRRQRLTPTWLRNIPGYFECGSDYVRQNSRPYLYWNGSNLTRVYFMDDSPEQGITYLSDLGALMGALVGPGDECAIEQVRANHPEYLEYSIVPEESDEVVVIGDRKCVLSHAFCTLTIPDVPDEDTEEDQHAD